MPDAYLYQHSNLTQRHSKLMHITTALGFRNGTCIQSPTAYAYSMPFHIHISICNSTSLQIVMYISSVAIVIGMMYFNRIILYAHD